MQRETQPGSGDGRVGRRGLLAGSARLAASLAGARLTGSPIGLTGLALSGLAASGCAAPGLAAPGLAAPGLAAPESATGDPGSRDPAATEVSFAGQGQGLGPIDRADWQDFRARFLAADGRVIDTGNGGVSHSEGQGYGLLFAQYADDQASFDRILAWTRTNLGCRGDALHAWRYQPFVPQKVADRNNATDGDLLIALALSRAAARWGRPDHARAAAAIGADVLRLLVCQAGGRWLLLPGAAGFRTGGGVIVNPSYYVFPALAALASLVPSPVWDGLQRDGLGLIGQGRFGRWALPPDWLAVGSDGSLAPATGWPARFSFDAIRVPLNLAWAGAEGVPAQTAFAAYWSGFGGALPPAWVDLQTGALAPYPAPLGFQAVSRLIWPATTAVATGRGGFPPVALARDYYSAALILLSRVASREGMAV